MCHCVISQHITLSTTRKHTPQVLDNQNSDGSFGNKNMWLERLYNEDGSENFGAKESM